MTEFIYWFLIGCVCCAIGFFAGRSTAKSNHTDGVIYVTQGEESDQYLFEFNIPPEQIPKMRRVIFQVKIEESKNLQAS